MHPNPLNHCARFRRLVQPFPEFRLILRLDVRISRCFQKNQATGCRPQTGENRKKVERHPIFPWVMEKQGTYVIKQQAENHSFPENCTVDKQLRQDIAITK